MTELNEQLIGCEATGRGTNKEEEISERELAGEKCWGDCPGEFTRGEMSVYRAMSGFSCRITSLYV